MAEHTREHWLNKLKKEGENLRFYSTEGLYNICKAVDGQEYDENLTEYHGYVHREIAREEYEKYKAIREGEYEVSMNPGHENFQCFPYPRYIQADAAEKTEIPYELIIPRKWIIHKQLQLTIEETFEYWTQFFDEDIPGIHIYIDHIKPETTLALAKEILPFIHPVTLDFPEYGVTDKNEGEPILLKDLRFLEPEKYEELDEFVDTEYNHNRSEFVNQIFYNFLEKFIPYEYSTLKYACQLLEEYGYVAEYEQTSTPKGHGIALTV